MQYVLYRILWPFNFVRAFKINDLQLRFFSLSPYIPFALVLNCSLYVYKNIYFMQKEVYTFQMPIVWNYLIFHLFFFCLQPFPSWLLCVCFRFHLYRVVVAVASAPDRIQPSLSMFDMKHLTRKAFSAPKLTHFGLLQFTTMNNQL